MKTKSHDQRQLIPVVRDLTADTITDEQIALVGKEAREILDAALTALTHRPDESTDDIRRRMVARARCAEILNARNVRK